MGRKMEGDTGRKRSSETEKGRHREVMWKRQQKKIKRGREESQNMAQNLFWFSAYSFMWEPIIKLRSSGL